MNEIKKGGFSLKFKIILVFIALMFLLSGCRGKNLNNQKYKNDDSKNTINKSEVSQDKRGDDKSTSSKTEKSDSASELNAAQKSQIDKKFDSITSGIEDSLKSSDDFKDIDLSPLN